MERDEIGELEKDCEQQCGLRAKAFAAIVAEHRAWRAMDRAMQAALIDSGEPQTMAYGRALRAVQAERERWILSHLRSSIYIFAGHWNARPDLKGASWQDMLDAGHVVTRATDDPEVSTDD